MKKKTTVSLLGIVSAVLMLALLILQFTPFWSANGDAASVQGMTWFPSNHSGLNDYFSSELGSNYSLNTLVLPTICILVLAAVGIVMSIIKPRAAANGWFTFGCGICGIWGYLFMPVYQLGSGWVLPLILSCLCILCSIPVLIQFGKNCYHWFKG